MKIKMIGLILLFLLLVSCDGDGEASITQPTIDGQPEASYTPVSTTTDTITLLFGANSTEMAGYTALAEAFTADNPNIHIKLVSIDGRFPPGNDPDRYRRIAETADVFVYNTLDGMGVEQVALELSPWLNAWPNFAPDDFYPGLLARGENDIWGVPLAATYYLIYYDTALFDAAGLDYPAADWSWETFRTTAQALTVREGDEVTQWGFVPVGLWTLTAPLLDGVPPSAMPAFGDEDMATRVAWLASLFANTIPWFDSYGQPNASPTEQLGLIGNQKAAMWVDDHTFAWDGRRVDVSVAPYPDGLLGDGVPVRVGQVAISRGTVHPEAAWQWIDFLSRQAPVGRGLPARRSVTAAMDYWDALDAPVQVAVQQSAERGVPFALNSPAQMALDMTVAQIVTGGATVETALQTAQETAAMQLEISAELPAESFSIIVPPPESTTGKTTIVFMAYGAPYDFQTPYTDLVEAFAAEQPNIDVELRNLVLADANQAYAEMVADVDCFADSANVIERNVNLIPVDPLFDNDPALNPDDFYAVSVQQLTYNGHLYGLPLAMDTRIIQYNKALFDEAGVPYPPLNWTLDEFLETAVALAQGEGDKRRYAFSFFTPLSLATTALAQFDVPLVEDGVDPPTLDFAATTEALRWYTNLVTEYEVMPPPPPLLDENQLQVSPTLNLIAADRLAMWPGSMSTNFMAEELPDMDIGETVFPHRQTGSSISSNLGVTALFIHADSSQPTACWEWFKFLTQSPVIGQGKLPARKSTATSAAFAAQVGSERMALYEALLNQADITSTSQFNMWNASMWWTIVYQDVVLNGLSVEEALAKRQARFDRFLACVFDNEAQANFEKQQSCYREVDPDGMGQLYGE